MQNDQIVERARQHVPELVTALRGLLEGLHETDQHWTDADKDTLHVDSRQAWAVWLKIATAEHVPQDILDALKGDTPP